MDKQTDIPPARGGFLPIVLTLGGLFLFLAIVAFVWLDRKPETVAFGGLPPEERVKILREQRERDRQMLEQYGWIDRNAGVVRLPIERAMELWLEETNQEQAQN